MRLFAREVSDGSSRNTGAFARGDQKQRLKTKGHRKGDRRVRADRLQVYERGFPALDTFAKLCAVLDVSSDYILGISKEM